MASLKVHVKVCVYVLRGDFPGGIYIPEECAVGSLCPSTRKEEMSCFGGAAGKKLKFGNYNLRSPRAQYIQAR